MCHFMEKLVIFLITLYKVSDVLPLPHVECPKLFQYVQEGDGYFARIKLSNLTLNTTNLNVRLPLEQDDQWPTEGHNARLSLELDPETVNRQLNHGEPITYRVDFPFPNEPLKLIDIRVNGETICFDINFLAFSFIQLYHTIVPVPESQSSQKRKMVEVSEKLEFYSVGVPLSFYANGKPLPPPDLRPVCGKEMVTKLSTVTPFVSGGVPIARGQFPWLSAIYSKFSLNIRFICGGSLISRRTVLSAAHCFAKLSFENVVVYLGRYNLDNYSEVGYVTRGIKKLVLHPEFNKNVFSADADMAILQLDYAVENNQYIMPICLWSEPDEPIDQIAGTSGTVAGWGSQGNDNTVSSIPRMVNITIASREECLLESSLFRMFGGKRTFCAGNGNDTGPCLGDSGGPFMIKRNGVWMLRGIVSAGETLRGNCDLKDYVLYCDVAKHLSWVKDNMV